MTVGLREAALLRAMGVDVWRARGTAASAAATAASVDAEGSIEVRGSADTAVVARTGPRPWDADPSSGAARRASGLPSGAASRPGVVAPVSSSNEATRSSHPPAEEPMPFPRVDLRIWRTGIALFVATFDDRVSQRFLADVQRAVDRNHQPPDLKALPHFQWPPPEHPELASLRSLRSAWRALIQRQHRERPVRLMVLFGEATAYVSAIADLQDPAASVSASAGNQVVSPTVVSVPAFQELQASPAGKRALWTRLLDVT